MPAGKDCDAAHSYVATALEGDRLAAAPGASAGGRLGSAASPRLRPRPQIRPDPTMATSRRFSPQMRLLCQ